MIRYVAIAVAILTTIVVLRHVFDGERWGGGDWFAMLYFTAIQAVCFEII